jgi:hypothetical protein
VLDEGGWEKPIGPAMVQSVALLLCLVLRGGSLHQQEAVRVVWNHLCSQFTVSVAHSFLLLLLLPRVLQDPLHYPHGTKFMAPGPLGQCHPIPDNPDLRRQMLAVARDYEKVGGGRARGGCGVCVKGEGCFWQGMEMKGLWERVRVWGWAAGDTCTTKWALGHRGLWTGQGVGTWPMSHGVRDRAGMPVKGG